MRRNSTSWMVVLVCSICALGGAAEAAAVSHTGALDGYASPVPSPGTYRPPVDAPVIDPFRPPTHDYGAGNRGLEYRTEPGTAVRSISAGQVVFAGPVGGRLAITVLHPDGRRSSYTWLAQLSASSGDLVATGAVLGSSADRLHLGVREGDRYVDPAELFVLERRRAVLVPDGGPRRGRRFSAPGAVATTVSGRPERGRHPQLPPGNTLGRRLGNVLASSPGFDEPRGRSTP